MSVLSGDRLIEAAIELAVNKHKGQVDKQKVPYILHPLRVMHRVALVVGLTGEKAAKHLATAVLHDVVEDCNVTLDDLRERGFPDEVVEAVDALSKRKKENYIAFVRRGRANDIARVVKVADVTDNRDRVPNQLSSAWWAKVNLKYTVALAILKDDYEWLEANKELVAGMENS